MTITAVLDTNVFVSAAISKKGAPGKLMALLEAEAFGVVMSSAILEEIAAVMRYTKIATSYHLTEDWIVEYLDHLRDVVTWTEPDVKLNIIEEDPSDNKYLECAVSAGAQYIVSGDKHLLGLRSYQGVEILTPAAFLALLQS